MTCRALGQGAVKLEAARGGVTDNDGIVVAPKQLVVSKSQRMSTCLVELGREVKGATRTMVDVQDDLATARLVRND